MPKLLRRLPWIVLPIAAVVVLVWYTTRPAPVAVRFATVERGDVETTVANTRAGTVRARRRAKLAPQLGGEVAVLAVREGDRVRTGQVLLQLWNDDLTAQLAEAEAQLAQAEARAEEERQRADWAERDAARLVELAKGAIASGEAAERAVTEANAARAAARAADAATKVAVGRIGVIRTQIEKTVLRAPFDGVVAEVNAELGEFATPSPPGIPTLPAIDLVDDSSLYVRAPIDEVDAPAVRVGQEARIALDAFAGRAFAGRVSRVASFVLDREKQARTVDIDVEFVERPDDVVLLPGYSADAEIVLERVRDVVRVPTEAVLEGGRVLVLDEASGTLAEQRFRPGAANWHWTQVLDGLAPGDRIVSTLAREGVRQGAAVVVEADGGAAR